MPPYGELLNAQERENLLDLIFRAFVGLDRPLQTELPPVPPEPQRLSAAEQVAQLYRDNCQRCHGTAGTGCGPASRDYLPRPRNLTNTPYFRAIEDARIARTIAHGVPGTGMPAFGEKLPPDGIWGLVERVRDFSRGQAKEGESP
jgi:mono/diheme cytochrome c family protein